MTKTQPRRFMLIDDDQFLLDMYALKFKQAGYEVEACPSALDALEKLRGGMAVDAVVTDSVMPGMGGLELLETARKEKLGGSPAYIMLSNQGQDSDLQEAKARGADGYIIKASAVPSEVLAQVVQITDTAQQSRS